MEGLLRYVHSVYICMCVHAHVHVCLLAPVPLCLQRQSYPRMYNLYAKVVLVLQPMCVVLAM